MLVLSRKVDEAVVIGEGPNRVKIVVVEVRGDKVRLGFETNASREDLPIHRSEIHEAIQQQSA